MTSFVSSVAIDSHDPAALARFWCEVLDYRVDHAEDEFVSALPSRGDGFRLDFIKVPEGKSVKNRLHLDLLPRDTDQQSEVARVEALGAYRVDVGQTSDDSWVVLADPEGNEFCILESHPAA